MTNIQSDTRYKERLVVLVPIETKREIAAAAANSAKDDHQISNLVRRAVDELIARERLLDSAPSTGKAA